MSPFEAAPSYELQFSGLAAAKCMLHKDESSSYSRMSVSTIVPVQNNQRVKELKRRDETLAVAMFW